MDTEPLLRQFSAHRLGGDPVPDDLRCLLPHHVELAERTGIELSWAEEWTPWLDHSYLGPAERKDPGIFANIRAMAHVSTLISFVAQDENAQWFGYWRGRNRSPLTNCPLIFLDNEGQFNPCVASNFAECVLEHTWGEEQFYALSGWFRSLGIAIPFDKKTLLARDWPERSHEAEKLHDELFHRYLSESKPAS